MYKTVDAIKLRLAYMCSVFPYCLFCFWGVETSVFPGLTCMFQTSECHSVFVFPEIKKKTYFISAHIFSRLFYVTVFRFRLCVVNTMLYVASMCFYSAVML